MRPLSELDAALEAFQPGADAPDAARRLLAIGEEVLEHWIEARGLVPTAGTQEGFRLLALHRQGARGVPSFNACRETCRELAYHYNLLCMEADDPRTVLRQRMMAMIARHLLLFVSGKMQVEQLGDFCCSSRPLRQEAI